MTDHSVERPTRRLLAVPRARSGLVSLRPGQATTGQPVTVNTLDADGNTIESPAVFVRTDGTHLRCQDTETGQTGRYRPSQVFPRHVTYRRWAVSFDPAVPGEGAPRVVPVYARTELEARFEALKRLGQNAATRLVFRTAQRDG